MCKFTYYKTLLIMNVQERVTVSFRIQGRNQRRARKIISNVSTYRHSIHHYRSNRRNGKCIDNVYMGCQFDNEGELLNHLYEDFGNTSNVTRIMLSA
jgi:hypothetical protein